MHISYKERTCLLTLLVSILLSPFSVLWLLHPFHHQKSFLTKPVTLSLSTNSLKESKGDSLKHTKLSKDTYLTLAFTTLYQCGRKIETTTFEVTIHLPVPAAVTPLDPFSFPWPCLGTALGTWLNTGPYKPHNTAFSITFLTNIILWWWRSPCG